MFALQRLGPKVLRTTSFQNQIAPSVYYKNTCFRNIGEIKLNSRRPQTLQCTSSALIDRFALTVKPIYCRQALTIQDLLVRSSRAVIRLIY